MSDIDRGRSLVNEAREAGMPEGAFTTTQLVEKTGRSRDWCDRFLRDAIALGLCEFVGDIPITNRVGRAHSTPHYIFTTKGKKKK